MSRVFFFSAVLSLTCINMHIHIHTLLTTASQLDPGLTNGGPAISIWAQRQEQGQTFENNHMNNMNNMNMNGVNMVQNGNGNYNGNDDVCESDTDCDSSKNMFCISISAAMYVSTCVCIHLCIYVSMYGV